MTTIAGSPSALESLGINSRATGTAERDSTAMVQEDFFKLMIAQMKNQDPSKPLDPNEYLSQLTTFSMVDGIQAMNQGFEDLAGSLRSLQTLQGASMVGREVLVEADQGWFDGDTLTGTVRVDAPVDSLSVSIFDASGSLVARQPLQAGGEQVAFAWDGTGRNGQSLPPGRYTVRAEGIDGDKSVALTTQVRSRVESVTLDPSGEGLVLNLAGMGARDISAVQAIY